MRNQLILTLLLLITLQSCQRQQTYFAYYEPATVRVDEKIKKEDSTALAMIAPYKVKLDQQMNAVIGYNEVELVKGKPSSTMTNWMADAMAESYERKGREKLDFAISNYGGIRINALAAGDITLGKMYEVMPFENALVVMDLDGRQTKQLLDRLAEYGGWPVSDGLQFEISNNQAVNIFIQGRPWQLEGRYRIGLPDYVANGGDDCDFLTALPRENAGLLIRDLLIDYVKFNKNIKPNSAQRIKLLKQ